MDGVSQPTVDLFVSTSVGNGVTASKRAGSKPIFLALLPFSLMGMLFIHKRRNCWLALLLVGIAVLMGTVGCGSGTSSSSGGPLAPGSYQNQVVVTATSGANTQTTTLSLVVTKQ
jgi:hypothetical protein